MHLTSAADPHFIPKKIISLVPSQTELLCYLGLNEEVVGITKFCVHPTKWFKNKQRVGGTKTLNIELIKRLQPDLILANKEENVKEQIEILINDFNVWVTDVNNLDDALMMIKDIGHLVKRSAKANQLVENIEPEFFNLYSHINSHEKLKGIYLIWQKPYMTIGGDTFINDMLAKCGIINLYESETRYPEITIEEIKEKDCDVILLSSEPFPFKEKHFKEFKEYFPSKKIILVDGEMFSWYGSRLLISPAYFKSLPLG